MKKVLLVFDGSNFSEGAFYFVHRMNEFQPCLLTGIILSDVNRALINIDPYSYKGYAGYMVQAESEDIVNNVQRFKELCREKNIPYNIHNDTGADDPMDELRKESRFADLLVIGSEVFYKSIGDGINENLNDILHAAECPIILVPEKFDFPARLVLTYDGSENAVFAIRQFADMFPELMDEEALLVYLHERDEDLPDRFNIEELVRQHYKHFNVLKLDANPYKDFDDWTRGLSKPIIIAGAYGRSVISEFFRKSFLTDAIKDHKCPIFIAHK